MSMSPQAMQQMLAMYKQQFPGGAQPVPTLMPPPASGFTGAQPQINTQPPTTSAITTQTDKLIAALIKAKQQRDLQDQQQTPKLQAGTAQPPPAPANLSGTSDPSAVGLA
jgi:hypothetical protein